MQILQQVFLLGKGYKTPAVKVRENAEGSNPIDAHEGFRFFGEIIHGDPEHWGILLTSEREYFSSIQATHLVKYDISLAPQQYSYHMYAYAI